MISQEFDQVARFWARVDMTGGSDACWPWIGCLRKSNGYGWVGFMGKHEYTHRLAWGLATGLPVPTGRNKGDHMILHNCEELPNHTNACCNPNHLYLGLQSDNVQDQHKNPANIKSCGKIHSHCGACHAPVKWSVKPCGKSHAWCKICR